MTHKPILTFTPALRKKLIVIFVTTLIGLQGMYVVFPLPEIWPLSSYPMFSRPYRKYVTYIEIRGVTAKGRELSLDISKYFYPFNRTKLPSGILRIRYYPLKRQVEILDEIFRYLLDQYAVTKKSGYHEGPPIVALRLYGNTWNWSQKPPEEVVPYTFLIYSTAMGQSKGEK